jgi:2-oxoglutarate ferredoxin oxidoreductase subunit alpha
MPNETQFSQEVTLAVVGSGGDGAVVAGDLIAMACAGRGFHVLKTEAYGPQIRGGESSSVVRIGSPAGGPLSAPPDIIDALVVFRFADFARFRSEMTLSDRAIVLHDPEDQPPAEMTEGSSRTFLAVPFSELAKESGAPGAKNIVAIGLLTAMFGLPAEEIQSAIRRRFRKRGESVIDANLRAFDRGRAHAAEWPSRTRHLPSESGPAHLLMSGNEASAFAAVHAGCTFFGGYPITPSSEILHLLSEWLPKIGGTCIQTEDELAAIGAVVGASFAGAKAMTSTSGPGLSLMSEMLGLAATAEIPSVIVNVQRGGPSTGIPTKSEQSDLNHAVYGSHGDTPRVVLACCDVEDAFHITVDAFNIAEEYQVPVIVLSDQLIAQRRETVDATRLVHDVIERRIALPVIGEVHYERYASKTPDGVSPMTVPGIAGGMYQTNGLEHDELGRPAAGFVVHERMNAKRYRKIAAIEEKYPLFRRFGAETPDVGVLCWGSSAGTVAEALAQLEASGKFAAFVPRIIAPLPKKPLQEFIDSCSEILVVEVSYAAQFHHYLRSEVDLPRGRTHVLARSGGKTLTVAEVVAAIEPLVRAKSLDEVLA